MRDIHRDLTARGGIASSGALKKLGHTDKQLSRAVRTGEVLRPRRGWIAAIDADRIACRAVQLGGRLGSRSALVSYGIWVDDPAPALVIATRHTASRLPELAAGERRVWYVEPPPPFASDPEWRVSICDALRQLAREASPDELVASVDSALHQRLIGIDDVVTLQRSTARRHRHVASRVDGRAESGNESHLRLLLRAAGLRVEVQVVLPDVGRVDLFVEDWLVVEADSRAHHGEIRDQVRDRIRDGNATLLAYGELRFMPEAIRDEPEWCLDVVIARLRQGRPVSSSGNVGATRRVPA